MSLKEKLLALKREREMEEIARREVLQEEAQRAREMLTRYNELRDQAHKIRVMKIEPVLKVVNRNWLQGQGKLLHEDSKLISIYANEGNHSKLLEEIDRLIYHGFYPLHYSSLRWNEWGSGKGEHGYDELRADIFRIDNKFSINGLDPSDRDFSSTLGDMFFEKIKSGETSYIYYPPDYGDL